jgi:uncharacterized Zn-finger protein
MQVDTVGVSEPVVQTDFNSLTCAICQKVFKRKDKLKNHIELNHTNNYSCIYQDCNQKFAKKRDFSTHVYEHKHGPLSPCKICGAKYMRGSGLSSHFLIHKKEKPFKCHLLLCNYSARNPSNLKRHMNIHVGLKNYVCICGSEYKDASSLKDHIDKNAPGKHGRNEALIKANMEKSNKAIQELIASKQVAVAAAQNQDVPMDGGSEDDEHIEENSCESEKEED